MSSKNVIKQQSSEMISLIDRAIATDHALLHPHHRHLVYGPLPSVEQRAVMISLFHELWTANDNVDYNTANTGWVTPWRKQPLNMLAYAVRHAQQVTKMGDRRCNLANGGMDYMPPSLRPRLDGDIWAMLLDRHDLDMSTLDYDQTVQLVTSLSDKHAMTIMMRPSFNVNPVAARWQFHDHDDEEYCFEGEANTLIGWLIEFSRCELVGMMVESVPDLVINRRHEYMFFNDDREHMHVAMVAANMTASVEHCGDYQVKHKAEQSLVAVLRHPDTDISGSKIKPRDVNVFCIRKLLQHETVDVHKIQADWEEWEGFYDEYYHFDEEEEGKGSGEDSAAVSDDVK